MAGYEKTIVKAEWARLLTDYDRQEDQIEAGRAEVQRLADRLGVAPVAPHEGSAMSLSGPDGTRYDLVALLHAVLDRLDAR